MIRKQTYTHKVEVPLRKMLVRWAVIAIALGLPLGPLVYEGSAILNAQWSTLLGHATVARTPVLDTLGYWARSTSSSTARAFQRVRLQPTMTIPLAIAWGVCCGLLLRRCGARG
ncbi:MAG TPA: hypothetical protein VGZ22_11395 [Isosphaeraceae bacterium]|jgi:hypothetical protein|nr:hypothetical protein [Isosphaeraceae bacterium]